MYRKYLIWAMAMEILPHADSASATFQCSYTNLIIALDLIILKPQARPMLLHRLSVHTRNRANRCVTVNLLIVHHAGQKTNKTISRRNGAAAGIAHCTTARAPSGLAADTGERRQSAGLEVQTKSGAAGGRLHTAGVHEAAESEPLRRGR